MIESSFSERFPTNPLAVRETRFQRVLYSHAAGVVVAQFERIDGARHTSSLYVRDAATNEYERLPAPDASTSYVSPIVARSVPYVFFGVMSLDERGRGDWKHVGRAHIETRAIDILLTCDDLRALCGANPKWPCQPWVSQLLSASDDGTTLTCVIGLPEARADGHFPMTYSVFDVELATRRLTRLADFHHTPSW